MKQGVSIILLCIAGCILVVKTILFKRSFPSKSLLCWFFFGHIGVKLTGNHSRRREKQQQNTLSLFALFTILLSVVWFLFLDAG